MRVSVFPPRRYEGRRRLTPADLKLLEAAHTAQELDELERRRRVTSWRLTWRVFDAKSPKGRLRKRSGFQLKGEAEAFADRLRWAALGYDGWTLDSNDQPVRPAEPMGTYTVFELTGDFWKVQWPAKSPAQRSKVAGRLNTMRQVLTTAAELPDNALAYLNSYSLQDRIEQDDSALPPDIVDGRAWLAAHSLALSDLNEDSLQPLYDALVEGRPYNTGRTYWTVVRSVFNWALEADRLEKDPTKGLPNVPRDVDSEQCDPDRIADRNEIRRMAWACGLVGGPRHVALPLVLGTAGLRIGEAVALRRRDVHFSPDGAAWLRIRTTISYAPAHHADGKTSTERPTKGRKSTVGRKTYLPSEAATILRTHMELFTGPGGGDYVFTGKRGGRLSADTHLRGVWRPAVALAYPGGHHLSDLRRHDLRHSAVTAWLRSGVPPKQCQQMGGWKSLKAMLDIYAGLYGDDDERAAEAIERFYRDAA